MGNTVTVAPVINKVTVAPVMNVVTVAPVMNVVTVAPWGGSGTDEATVNSLIFAQTY